MADVYIDTDGGGSSTSPYDTWAKATTTIESAFAAAVAGDNIWRQGTTGDDSASDRTLTSPGTFDNPCAVIGVADGTTNEPPVIGDLASTLPVISTTGAAPDINFAGSAVYSNITFTIGDRVTCAGSNTTLFRNGKVTFGDRFTPSPESTVLFKNTELEPTTTGASFRISDNAIVEMRGGTYTFTAAAVILEGSAAGVFKMVGVDLSGLTAAFAQGSPTTLFVVAATLKNCKIPASMTLMGGAPLSDRAFVEMVSCSNTSSQAVGSSIQDYEYEDVYGTISLEATAVRTGGGDDGADGLFAYAMTPTADGVKETSGAALKSPWMSVWVAGGSTTLTVYIANDASEAAANDYHEDEVWCEFYTPSAADSAQHDQNFDPADERIFPNTTSVTDDTGSAWGTGANNDQKMSTTVTTGFEGWAYARLHLAKREAATPVTLYLDPKIEVT